MQEKDFILFLKHFHNYVKSTTERPVLLLLDSHGLHLSIEGLNFAKNNGIIMLYFPPHCSHKLQPLDRTVFGPFKKYLNSAGDSWIINNPGKTMTIYDRYTNYCFLSLSSFYDTYTSSIWLRVHRYIHSTEIFFPILILHQVI